LVFLSVELELFELIDRYTFVLSQLG